MLKLIPDQYLDESKKTMKLLWEDEWRSMGITQVSDPGPNKTPDTLLFPPRTHTDILDLV
jgi:hypothetical protein